MKPPLVSGDSDNLCYYKGHLMSQGKKYRQTCNISRTLVGNTTVGHSDVIAVSPVGAAPTTSSFST